MKRPLGIMPFRAGRRGSRRWHLGVTLGAAHAFQFQTLVSFETLKEAESALNRASTDESYRLELYGWKNQGSAK